jgi:hypothetical protein
MTVTHMIFNSDDEFITIMVMVNRLNWWMKLVMITLLMSR